MSDFDVGFLVVVLVVLGLVGTYVFVRLQQDKRKAAAEREIQVRREQLGARERPIFEEFLTRQGANRLGSRLVAALTDCMVESRAGIELDLGTVCEIAIFEGGLTVCSTTGKRVALVSLAQVAQFDCSGGAKTSSAGLVGGGIGLRGAAQGVLLAEAINAATRTVWTDTRLKLVWDTGAVVVRTAQVTPEALESVKLKLQVIHQDRSTGQLPSRDHRGAQSGAGSTLAEQLTALAEMHRDGLLSDTEFAMAKSRVLGAGS